ncbi:MAG: 16S rRNA (cytidine(1402)-2'-O)-methyltransferase [Alphaproteobacteria bacterium]|nr:MAG: 16S rRNA (cytidine(1402)-2'-O)-methyltransferase [Alphaproteobacteria bacterium]
MAEEAQDGAAPARIEPGLWLVATPIGNARDITLRALDVLAGAEVLAAEDTRRLRQLMTIHGIPRAGREILAYHDHNGPRMRPRLLAELRAGRSVAYVSDAGTPLISDPGFDLARAAIAEGIAVHAAPGPSAVLAALSVAGLPPDRFVFLGFLPQRASARRALLDEAGRLALTLVLYEAPGRAAATLAELAERLGADRPAALCRELTKRHEEVWRGALGELAARAAEAPPRGEVVIVVGPAGEGPGADAGRVRRLLEALVPRLGVKDSARLLCDLEGMPRREAYNAALEVAARLRRSEED